MYKMKLKKNIYNIVNIVMINNILKGVLLLYLTFWLLPLNHLFNTNIQTVIGEFQFMNIHPYIRRIFVATLFIYSFYINDPMLTSLLVLFIVHSTNLNSESTRKGSEKDGFDMFHI